MIGVVHAVQDIIFLQFYLQLVNHIARVEIVAILHLKDMFAGPKILRKEGDQVLLPIK